MILHSQVEQERPADCTLLPLLSGSAAGLFQTEARIVPEQPKKYPSILLSEHVGMQVPNRDVSHSNARDSEE